MAKVRSLGLLVLVLGLVPSSADESLRPDSCSFVRLQCSYRTGCSRTLQSFLLECDGLIRNQTQVCSEWCKNTLVGLTSTLEGERLMQCHCENDTQCKLAKSQIESCRDLVAYATRSDTVVTCTEARWICMADAECGKALEYYNQNCGSMFRGVKCSRRCQNSIGILRRQIKAAKLLQCYCQPDEKIDEYLCQDIKTNMMNLCSSDSQPDLLPHTTLSSDDVLQDVDDEQVNEVDTGTVGGVSCARHYPHPTVLLLLAVLMLHRVLS